jgi:hypothetical protein
VRRAVWTAAGACAVALAPLALTGCEYVRLLRPSVLKQLNPRVVRLVNELPATDNPNEALIGGCSPTAAPATRAWGATASCASPCAPRRTSSSGSRP